MSIRLYDLERQLREYEDKIEDLKREIQKEQIKEHFENNNRSKKEGEHPQLIIKRLTKEEYETAIR